MEDNNKIHILDYDLFIFDFDGTIMDTEKYHCLAWNNALSKYKNEEVNISLDDYFKKNLGKIDKDLEFNIVGIDFSYLRDTQSLVDEIIFLYINDNEINETEKESLKKELNSSFAIFLENYNKYLKIFENNEEFQLDNDFINFIYVYILLSAYKTALIESKQELSAFKVTSWWFFTQGDFIDIKNDLDLKNMIEYDFEF